ncbi:uncharacterized protein [Musca autumnalis]|uniref:uncharacterized protein n=1 Tax=Musca autumnalis TaxID=221902 RepID=UPI003CF77AEB
MALKIEEAMDLSLDEYIAMTKKSSNDGKKATTTTTVVSSKSNDAKFGRRKSNLDDDEDDDLDLFAREDELLADETITTTNDNDTGIWKGPDSNIAYLDCNNRQQDLRERINSNSHNNNNNGRKQQISAVQYRLMAPNNSADRPRGLPTLLPLDAYVKKQNNQNNRRWNYNRNRGRQHNGNRGNSNGFNNNNNNRNGNGLSTVNNGRIQRNRNQDYSKNFRFTVDSNQSVAASAHIDNNKPKNIYIECPRIPNSNMNSNLNSSSSMQSAPQMQDDGNRFIPIGNLTPQAQAALNLQSMNTTTVSPNAKDLLGFQGNLASDMMPVFASRLLELIQNNTQTPVHKPIYDMKIQKDIHELQKKPLVYKCPGGDVVSSDGAGVNCQITPNTSGISMNCRFA